MNQTDKQSRSLIEALITDIIAEIPLEDKVRFAKLVEDEVQILEAVLSKLISYRLGKLDEKVNEELLKECRAKLGDKSLDHSGAAVYILKELWNRLRETHKLRAIK